MGKGWFSRTESSVINKPTFYRVYLLSHLFGEGFGHTRNSPLNKAYLTHFTRFRIPQTALAHFAYPAIGLPASEFNRCVPIQNHIAAVSVKTFPCRTNAESLVFTQDKVLRPVQSACPKILCPLFSEPLFILIDFCKPGITFPELCVCYIGVYPFFHNHLHVRLGVIPAVGHELRFFKYVLF